MQLYIMKMKLNRKDIRIGDFTVTIERAGDVIPHILINVDIKQRDLKIVTKIYYFQKIVHHVVLTP